MSLAYANADAKLNADLQSGTPHIQLHVGNPGNAGTANLAQSGGSAAARKSVTFGAAGNHATNTERRSLSTAGISWTGAQIDASQNITHFTVWSALSGGNILYISAVATPKTTGSDGVTIASGDIEVALGVFAKP